MKARSIIVAIATTLVLALGISPAFAQPGPPDQDKRELAAKRKARKGKKFPMQAKRFKALIAKRLQKASTKLDRQLKKRKVPPAKAKKIQAKFKQGVAVINKAADKAAADGKVTKKEAKRVRQLTKKMRKQVLKKRGNKANKRKGKAKRNKANKRKGKAKRKGNKRNRVAPAPND